MFILSGYVELLFLAYLIASEVCSVVICMGVDFRLLVNLSMILYLLCVVICKLFVEVFSLLFVSCCCFVVEGYI